MENDEWWMVAVMTGESMVLVERAPPIVTVTMNRPAALNALSDEMMEAVVSALMAADSDPEIRCLVLAGGDKAFAAGADIEQMSSMATMEFAFSGRVERWDAIRRLETPLVAAVSGHCLGGGCELAMTCDTIVASETARFGQPETAVGLIPGAGGTQRLSRAVGKAKAMDMVLTGRTLTAWEAEEAGLVARVVMQEAWRTEAKRLAGQIAARAPIAQRLAKQAVDRAFEGSLSLGLEFERKALYLTFASDDACEGLSAFVEKREPMWQSR